MKSAPIFVWILDPKGTIVLNTGAGLGSLGLQQGETIGINVLEQYAGNESVTGIVRRALAGTPCSGLVEDQGRFFQTTYSPIHDAEGRLTGAIGVAMDVTEQRRLEQRRRQQQKMESLGVLAGGIAHDFNNILYAMDGFAALAAKEVREHPTASECLAEMRTAVQRAVALVERILAFSRHEEPRFGSVNVADCAKRVMRMLERSLPDKVHFRFEEEADTPMAWGDASYLERILSNLVSNAMYAMRNHGGEIHVRIAPGTLQHPGPGSRPGVLIEVSDSGGGFDPELKERMFEPFYSTKPVRDGTGLGLAIVHSLVESLGGVVDANSEPGRGSTFSVCLPVEGDTSTHEIPQGVDGTLLSPGPSRRVLVVEDEPQVRHLLRMVLTDGGHECTCCPGGEEALALLAGGYLPDLVIADLTMPGMGGLDLLRGMRERGHAIPVILCSGHYSELNRVGLEELGVAEKIRKPIDPAALLALVAKATQHLEEAVRK
jgi:signal transduction histidine kinase/ActR/RegA family two-component response regulator